MKTIVRNIGITLFLFAVVHVVNASELEFKSILDIESEPGIELEAWMTNNSLFDVIEIDSEMSTVVEIAVTNPDFSTLVEAVKKAGLAEALSSDGPFTVFAPTNKAFDELFSQLGVGGIEELTAEQLAPILKYHVVSGKIMSTDLSNTAVGTLNQGHNIKIDISDGVKINDGKVIAADISGKNGVVHVIDKVLLPE